MHIVGQVLYYALTVFLLLLLVRLVMDYVFMFAREYRPAGGVAMLLEVTYTATDPPLKALQRVIPPLRIGNASIDLAFLVVFIATGILRSVFGSL